jgi:hypothetical protein
MWLQMNGLQINERAANKCCSDRMLLSAICPSHGKNVHKRSMRVEGMGSAALASLVLLVVASCCIC